MRPDIAKSNHRHNAQVRALARRFGTIIPYKASPTRPGRCTPCDAEIKAGDRYVRLHIGKRAGGPALCMACCGHITWMTSLTSAALPRPLPKRKGLTYANPHGKPTTKSKGNKAKPKAVQSASKPKAKSKPKAPAKAVSPATSSANDVPSGGGEVQPN